MVQFILGVLVIPAIATTAGGAKKLKELREKHKSDKILIVSLKAKLKVRNEELAKIKNTLKSNNIKIIDEEYDQESALSTDPSEDAKTTKIDIKYEYEMIEPKVKTAKKAKKPAKKTTKKKTKK